MTEMISVKMPHALALQMDARTANRSDFIREAVEKKLAHGRKSNRASLFDAVRPAQGALKIVPAQGQVRRVKL